MYPFWETVIAPLIHARGAERIVEIGALRGETTIRLLEDLGPDAEIHVIDPLPEFDPAEHEQRFPGRYVFHRDLSLNVLPTCGAFDTALIDGDHNWYTVYHELQELRAAAQRAKQPLPLLILHDVGWPYGRRDLYYEPSQIPEDSRQPYDRRGMTPRRTDLLKNGGMNIGLANALVEGGERNGVRTALDDFLAEHQEPLRVVTIPIYFGLAIVAEEAVLEDHPDLRAALDHLESPQGTRDLLELSEQIRLDAVVFEHNIGRVQNERLTRSQDRYLRLLRSALLDEHYFDNELRIEYLLERAAAGRPPDPEVLRNPSGMRQKEHGRLQAARRAGTGGPADENSAYFVYASMGTVHLDHLGEAAKDVMADDVAGDFVVCGAGRGGGAIYLRGILEAFETLERSVWVADPFRPGRSPTPRPLTQGGIADLGPDLNQVRDGFARFDLLDDRVRFLQGDYDVTLDERQLDTIALLYIGADAAASAATILERLEGALAEGSVVIIEDASHPSTLPEVTARSEAHQRIGVHGVTWRVPPGDRRAVTSPGEAPDRFAGGAPLAPGAPSGAIDLSVVVVFHNMKREATRTLHSLTRSYQLDIDALDYEVVVIDNGSDGDQRLTPEFVAGFGAEFRFLDLAEEATPSPTTALNRGIDAARGRSLALMIDGAHVLSPRVLALGAKGLTAFAPAVVATQQWYVGPGQQPEAVERGYDQHAEDQLFDTIGWPVDGYRLFDIGHFIGDRDWFDGILESNCLFAPRSLLEQVGGFDNAFEMPGGGYTNLDLYERLSSAPGITLVSLLGEATFHQVHGGTTTNDPDRDERRAKTSAYSEHYRELRGRTMRGPVKPLHFVGSLRTMGARRTRSRRMGPSGFAAWAGPTDADGIPETPRPVPDELRTAAIEAFWNSLAWTSSTWMGHGITAPPSDLMVYQELVTRLEPRHIVVTGDEHDGRAAFLTSICALTGHGRVISVTETPQEAPIPGLTTIRGAAHRAETIDAVTAAVGHDPRCLVILGADGNTRTIEAAFDGLAPLVPVGSFVIVENTIRNGHPVWPAHGPGPFEAVRLILGRRRDFVQDTSLEKYLLTFNPGGFLRRIG